MSSDKHDSEQEQRAAVILACVIIGALVAAIFVFKHTPKATASDEEAPAEKVKAQPAHPKVARIPLKSRRELVRGAKNNKRLNLRQEYAQSLNRRLRAKGRTCVVRATGELGRELQFRWTKDNLDKEHMEKLKLADGFFEQLKNMTFSRLAMKVDDKVVWSKSF